MRGSLARFQPHATRKFDLGLWLQEPERPAFSLG
jgi:hypothetical protein